MNKILVICGPTAMGKTSIAIKLAKKFDGELVSADSRQIYKKMDVGTGKDIPDNSKFEYVNKKFGGYYLVHGVKLWGYDLVDPDEEFSVSDYINIARGIIDQVWEKNHLPIVVGGTGFYIKGLIDGIKTAGIKKDKILRKKLEGKSSNELFEILKKLDEKKASSLNESDRYNDRRLIRAIEVTKNPDANNPINEIKSDNVFIGLKTSPVLLKKFITDRVHERINNGLIEEIEALHRAGVKWGDQSMTGTGYRQMKGYFRGSESIEDCIDKWCLAEIQYSKRQITWFKKEKRIDWYDIEDPKYYQKIEKIVARWYFSK